MGQRRFDFGQIESRFHVTCPKWWSLSRAERRLQVAPKRTSIKHETGAHRVRRLWTMGRPGHGTPVTPPAIPRHRECASGRRHAPGHDGRGRHGRAADRASSRVLAGPSQDVAASLRRPVGQVEELGGQGRAGRTPARQILRGLRDRRRPATRRRAADGQGSGAPRRRRSTASTRSRSRTSGPRSSATTRSARSSMRRRSHRRWTRCGWPSGTRGTRSSTPSTVFSRASSPS